MLHPRNGFYEITRQFLLPDVPLQFEQLGRLQAARNIDAVVAHHIAFGAIWWAEERGVPLTLGWLSPAAVIRPDGHGSMLPGVARRTPKLLSRALRLLVPIILRRELDAAMNATRTALGLRPERNSMLRLLTSDHGHIALWDEALRSQAPGDPPGLVTCGFPFLEDDGAALPAEIAEFLETDPPPIVCALGTTGGPMPLPVADLVAEACELAGRRALLIGDRPPTLASELALGRVHASRARFREGADRRPSRGDGDAGGGSACRQAESRAAACERSIRQRRAAQGARRRGDTRRSQSDPGGARARAAQASRRSVLPRVRRRAWAHACALRTERGVPPTP